MKKPKISISINFNLISKLQSVTHQRVRLGKTLKNVILIIHQRIGVSSYQLIAK